MLKQMRKAFRQRFGDYNAATPGHRRKSAGSRVRTPDSILTPTKRNTLIEGARDLQRNFSTVAWMIRKHLDYVSNFEFQAETEYEGFNERLEQLIGWWSRAINFDIAARHSRPRFTRLLEARRVMDGDVFVIKMRDGRLQGVEGDRVRTPRGISHLDVQWIHGVKVGRGGMLKSIAVHQRQPHTRYIFEREVSAKNALQLGYFDAFDQVRGVSPLTSALDSFQDMLEVQDYARAKAKISQIMALAITRELSDLDEEEETEDSGGGYDVDFGKGPIKMELDPGDQLEFVESKHPSTEFQQFADVTIQAALKALDIPTSFYREDFTNYSGSRQALNHYMTSVKEKRRALIEVLDRLLVWRISMWVARGILELPPGMRIGDIKWQWIPTAPPPYSPDKELKAEILAVDNKLKTRSDVCKERFGTDFKTTVRRLKAEEEFLQSNGLDPEIVGIPASSEDTVPEQHEEDEPNPRGGPVR